MAEHYDEMETRAPETREAALFAALPGFLAKARKAAPGLGRWLAGHDSNLVTGRAELAKLPVLRKSDLMDLQAAEPPFGGFADLSALRGSRLHLSPGPIWEPQGPGADPWLAARAFFAVGVRPGHLVHNAFAYHMTPGGFILDYGARALGCAVFAAGTGNTEMQVEAAATLRPDVYAGTPDYLKTLLDKAAETARDLSSLRIGLVSGGALFPSMRAEYRERGVAVFQAYATAEFGVIAYESAAADGTPNPGLIVNEDLIVEIVRPGTGEPLPDGEVGEVVVTSLDPHHPLIRFALGDLSAVLAGESPCGRTNMRIKGWMGRADQTTKVKGMFVRPEQVAEIAARHPELKRLRLVVTRDGEADAMLLRAESATQDEAFSEAVAASLRTVTKLQGKVELVAPDTLPNDGKVIADERPT